MILRSAASGQLDKVAQGHGTDLKIVYCRCMKNETETMTEPKCIAVIGGDYLDGHYEGECFDSLRLFDCQSTADAYKEEIKDEFEYVLMKVITISQYSAMMGGTIG